MYVEFERTETARYKQEVESWTQQVRILREELDK